MTTCGSCPVNTAQVSGVTGAWLRGTCSPELLVRQLRVSCQGHTLLSAPIMKPVNSASTVSWKCRNARVIRRATDNSPTRHPSRKSPRLATSNDLIAASMGEYMPIITSRKLPDMPGRIMAQIDSAPAQKNASCEGATSLAGRVVTHQAKTTPATSGASKKGEK